MSKKFTVKLNNQDKIEELLQESYDLACQQYNTIQNEINKITNTTVVNNLDIDGKEKYGKIMKEYLTLQQKSVNMKIDISKLLSDIYKYGGDVKKALNDDNVKHTTLNISQLRQIAKDINTNAETTEEYKIKGK